jgi:methionyl-tRNA formyltransferase
MNVIYITTDDPLYLPAFFARVLEHGNDKVAAVFIAPPLYKNESARAAAMKYFRTFGLMDFAGLAWRVALAKLKRQSISAVCCSKNVPCSQVADVNVADFLERLKGYSPDLIISVSCPQIFKKPLIDLPKKGILNLHGAILPQYRGVMPSFWMMANGEAKAGVSIYFVNEKIDAGDLCGQRVFDILRHETLDQFLRRSKRIAADLTLATLRRIKKGKITRTPLNLSHGSYNSWPDAAAVQRFRAAGRRMW